MARGTGWADCGSALAQCVYPSQEVVYRPFQTFIMHLYIFLLFFAWPALYMFYIRLHLVRAAYRWDHVLVSTKIITVLFPNSISLLEQPLQCTLRKCQRLHLRGLEWIWQVRHGYSARTHTFLLFILSHDASVFTTIIIHTVNDGSPKYGVVIKGRPLPKAHSTSEADRSYDGRHRLQGIYTKSHT